MIRYLKLTVLIIISIVATFLFSRSLAARDQPMKKMHALLEEEKSELIDLQKEIKKQNKKISFVGKKQSSLLRELRRIEHQVKLKERELAIYKWNAKINQKRVVRLVQRIGVIDNLLKKKKIELMQWLRVIYKEGGLFPVRLLFSANGVTDLLQRVRFMRMVTEYDANLFRDYRNKLSKLKIEKETLLKVRSDLVLLQNKAENKKTEFKVQKNKQRQFLRKLKSEKSLGIQLQKELIQASLALDKIIVSQEKKISQGERFDIIDHKGRLTLPAKGPILNRFGKKRDKRYDSYMVYNGINIKVPQNTSVRAIYSGKILYTGFLEGYGKLIILGHGNNIHSVYGHLNKILCRVGQRVGKDRIIGKSGGSGSMTGESLYFELRQNGKAVNPSSWVRMTRK